jgi:co-chaperonin GroES (HSP10)
MPPMRMVHEKDPREVLWKEVGELDDIEIAHNQVLCAIYQRPEKTATGIHLPDNYRDEDKFQGKVAMIVKLGAGAFKDDTGRWQFLSYEVGDWVFFRTSESWPIAVNKKACRIVDDVDIRGRIQHPDMIW